MAENTFKQAYGALQKHAEALRTQQEPNIDNLLTIVTESVDAYKVCKERIDAVEKALEQALSGAGVSQSEGNYSEESHGEPPPDRGSSTHPAFDDIPF
jgi:exodeoxyribonuclease VII small subunit